MQIDEQLHYFQKHILQARRELDQIDTANRCGWRAARSAPSHRYNVGNDCLYTQATQAETPPLQAACGHVQVSWNSFLPNHLVCMQCCGLPHGRIKQLRLTHKRSMLLA